MFSQACIKNSVHRGNVHGGGVCGGGHVWHRACVVGGMHGRGHAWQVGCAWQGEHVWQGGMHGGGACIVEGMHGRGHAWQGTCMAGGHAWQGKQQLQQVVHILLECIIVCDLCFYTFKKDLCLEKCCLIYLVKIIQQSIHKM